MDTSKVMVRPLRFAFLVDPRDKATLQTVFEVNSVLWGGAFNFIIPLFKRIPKHYKQPYDQPISVKKLLNGFTEAYQPDFLVETKSGQAASLGIDFPKDRLIAIEKLMARDERGRCNYGIDLRTVCNNLYKDVFRFVQRHPPRAVIPVSSDPRYKMFYSATFGYLPDDGPLKDIEGIYRSALDGKREEMAPVDYTTLFGAESLFPLRATAHELDTTPNSWSIGSHLFYIDPFSPYELIEFWNLRALGWKIRPVPIPLAPFLIEFCSTYIKQEYRPYPPPSNAFHMVQIQSAPSRSIEELQAFAMQLTSPGPHALSITNRYPRVWEEWGRSADHAEPQTVSNAITDVMSAVLGSGLHIASALPDFAKEDPFTAQTIACANVLVDGDFSDRSPVIPWKSGVASSLTHNFTHAKTWISREGIVTFAGRFTSFAHVQVPNAHNIFSAVAKSLGYSLSLSPSGRTCEQIIGAVGSLQMMRLVGTMDIMRLFDQIAHEDVEIEVEAERGRRRVAKSYASKDKVLEAIRRSNGNWEIARTNHLDSLIRRNILKLGIALACDHCLHSSWFSLEAIGQEMTCPRCSSKFPFPAAGLDKDAWAYRVAGAFATSHYAHGAYCVAAALAFITENIARIGSTWLPSFEMKNSDDHFEVDFGLYAKPHVYEHTTTPHLFLGECKSFNRLNAKDFARARAIAKLFPGAILCFCTFNDSFSSYEIRELTKLVISGRKRLDVGKQANPVLLLTGTELFGQYKIGSTYEMYFDKKEMAQAVFSRNDIQETCDFTQQMYLGTDSYHTWLDKKRQKRIAKRSAQNSPKPNP